MRSVMSSVTGTANMKSLPPIIKGVLLCFHLSLGAYFVIHRCIKNELSARSSQGSQTRRSRKHEDVFGFRSWNPQFPRQHWMVRVQGSEIRTYRVITGRFLG